DPDLYVTSGSNENRNGSAPLQDRLYINTGSNNFRKAEGALPNTKFSGSCIKPCDFDNDGDLDLFVGGRQIPGKYPYPASSCILKNESVNGNIRFIDVTQEVAPQLKDIGMVTDATWTDISNDGKPDLVVVGEWMSVKILKNTRNRFEDITNHSGLANDIGWWNSILSDDFDGDGDMDLIAGNLGLNYKYKATKEKPFEVFARDFDNNGINDIVIGYYNEGDKLYPLRGRDCSSMQMPFIKKKFPTHDAYGRATLEDVYGADNLKKALNYKANNFATCYIENKGNEKFEISQLDNLAQISSVNGILSFDINKDGNPDVVIGGNLYDSEVETVRNDAGVGLLLAGDGNGGFNPVPANISGLKMQGDVKGISLIGLGNNGRKGIIVAKNNDKLQVIEINK
ncbi:MAG: VCBS repeat-containing protein, partial [Bacteroidota bacterium]